MGEKLTPARFGHLLNRVPGAEHLSDRERQVLEHTLGLDRSDTLFRNHFAAEVGHDDYRTLQGLVEAGWMRKRAIGGVPGWIFHVVDAVKEKIISAQQGEG